MFYALFITIIINGAILEQRWRTYDRFEECWEAATLVVKHRDDMTATCVAVPSK